MLGRLLGATFGFNFTAIAIAVSLGLGVVGGMKLADGRVQKLRAAVLASELRSENNYKAAMSQKAARDASEALRGKEAAGAVVAVDSTQAACNARVAAVRASNARLAKLMARPVTPSNSVNCQERLWGADDLRPVLQPEGR